MSNIMVDTLTSLITGQGDPQRDKLAAVRYSGEILEADQIHNAYRTSWMAKRLVNIPAKDALKNWRLWQGTPDQVNAIENHEKELKIQHKMLEALIKSRALGGAAIFIGTGEADLTKPLDPSRIKKGGIKYLTVLTRNQLKIGEINKNVLSEYYGKPEFFTLKSQGNDIDIHASRLAVFRGDLVLEDSLGSVDVESWGDSVIQSSWTALRNSNSADDNIASMIFEANINVIKIPDLMGRVDNGEQESLLLKRLMLAAAQKGLHGDVILDTDEELSRHPASFGGLGDLMERFAILVGASQGIPASKFLGQSPKGLNSNNAHELDNYHDDIKTMQIFDIQPALSVLDECLIRSALGNRPEDISYLWSPLTQPTASEISETGVRMANIATALKGSGLYEDIELRNSITNQLVNFDILPSLGDELLNSESELEDEDFGMSEDAADKKVNISE